MTEAETSAILGTDSTWEELLTFRTEEVINTYRYDPYGTLTSGNVGESNYYGYREEETNPITGMQYLRYRYYDTAAGRFQTPDSYLGSLIQPISQNRYGYTGNNPVMYGDKSGHESILTILGAIAGNAAYGGIVGGGIGAFVGFGSSVITQAASGQPIDWERAINQANICAKAGMAGGAVGGGIAGGLGCVVGGGLAATIAVGIVSAVPSGMVARGVATYNQNQYPQYYPYRDPVEAALDKQAVLTDVVAGGIMARISYLPRNTTGIPIRPVCSTTNTVASQNADDIVSSLYSVDDSMNISGALDDVAGVADDGIKGDIPGSLRLENAVDNPYQPGTSEILSGRIRDSYDDTMYSGIPDDLIMSSADDGTQSGSRVDFNLQFFAKSNDSVADKWYKSTFDTVEDSMAYHLNKHGNGRTIEQYTDDAMTFYEENKHLGVEVILKDGTEAIRIQTGTGKNKVGGYWTIDGKLVTFWD